MIKSLHIHRKGTPASVLAALILVLAADAAVGRDDVLAQAQWHLSVLGYDPGPLDGSWGNKTATAFAGFYKDSGKEFDGQFSQNEVDDLYGSLSDLRFNSAPLEPLLDATTSQTSEKPEYDFVPPSDLTKSIPIVDTVQPFHHFAERIRAASGLKRINSCNWVANEPIPPPGGRLVTYASFAEFESASRTPHPGNRWLEDVGHRFARASAHLAATDNWRFAEMLAAAFVDHAEAGTGLSSANLLDRDGNVIVTSDFGNALRVATSLMLSYALVEPQLPLSDEDRSAVEQWLNRLHENYADSFFLLQPGTRHDIRSVDIVGRAFMARGLLNRDADDFNFGARLVATAISFTRPDGSNRFGASRGNRALWYQGTAMTTALESLVLLESQDLDVRNSILPTIDRMAMFLDQAWADNSLLEPYARENVSVTPGSDYRKQDKFTTPEGLDLYFALRPDAALGKLLQVRDDYPHSTLYTEVFNGTCLGLGFPDGSGDAARQLASLTGGELGLLPADANETYSSFRATIAGAELDGELLQPLNFLVLTDYSDPEKTAESIALVRMQARNQELSSATVSADYSECGNITSNPFGKFLHFGPDSLRNDCVLDRMTDAEAEIWGAAWKAFPTLVLEAALGGDPSAVTLHHLLQELGAIEPVDLPEPAATASTAPSIKFESGRLTITGKEDGDAFTGYNMMVYGAKLAGKSAPAIRFEIFADFGAESRLKVAENLELLRIAVDRSVLTDPQSRNADYAICGELASAEWGFKLHYGPSEEAYDCVWKRMAPQEADLWRAAWATLPDLVAQAAAQGDQRAEELAKLFTAARAQE
ncbi:hypothetical protein [Devosia salina]|uniref:Uncharacterized protein n=1 Tax=Devosia salina TaxID=2860336 RepID=A0ABX8WAM2_9HYPH|nr:hypothetical protein [Devosia salina]QYO75165.1 hypothetical protein K1X15_10870 [Devosia salina]